MEKDWLTSLVDGYYDEKDGYITGDITKSTYTIPLSYQHEIQSIPIDIPIQHLLEKQILPADIFNRTSLEQNIVHIPSDRISSMRGNRNQSHNQIEYQLRIQLYVMQTCGDGNCLLHAISLGLWGKDDAKHHLRGLLSLTLTSPELKKKLLSYWCEEEFYRDYVLGFKNARTLEEIQSEFDVAVNIAHEPGRYLEGIHIATLSHMLRRPIICYSQDISGNVKTDVMGQSLSGIYLPILHDPKDCCKIPLAIVYTLLGNKLSDGIEFKCDSDLAFHSGHFSSVIGANYEFSTQYNKSISDDVRWLGCYPLVNSNFRILPLRYCYPYDKDLSLSQRKDRNRRDQLLNSYLEIGEYIFNSSETLKKAPVALCIHRDDPSSYSLGSAKQGYGLASSLVVKSTRLFFSKVLDSKRSELEMLRAKIKEVEVLEFQKERSSLLDYRTMKTEQERTTLIRRRTEESERRGQGKRNDSVEQLDEQSQESAIFRSPKDRAGTPKRVYPPAKFPDNENASTFQTQQEQKRSYWKKLGLEFYNGELLTHEEAQQLKNALKLSLQTCNDDVEVDVNDDKNPNNHAEPKSIFHPEHTYLASSNVPSMQRFQWGLDRPTTNSLSQESPKPARPSSAPRISSRTDPNASLYPDRPDRRYNSSSQSTTSVPYQSTRGDLLHRSDSSARSDLLHRSDYSARSDIRGSDVYSTPRSDKIRPSSTSRTRWI